jgi:methyl-accepting chemotaxis protein
MGSRSFCGDVSCLFLSWKPGFSRTGLVGSSCSCVTEFSSYERRKMEAVSSEKSGGKGFAIFYQILITMLVIAVIPLCGLWYISIYKAKDDWTKSNFQTLATNTQALAERVDEWTLMNLRLLEQNAKVPDMLGMDAVQQNPILKSMADTYDWVYLAFTIRPDGENVGRSDGEPAMFYGDREYFKQVMGGKEIGQQVLLGKTSGKPAFILAKPVIGDRQKSAGVLAIAMTLENLSATVTKTRIGATGYAILVDDHNRLIAHGKGAIANELQDMGGHPVLQYTEKIDGNSFVFEYEGKKIVAYKHTTNLGWKLIVQQDFAEAYAPAEKAREQALLLLAATLAIVLVVALLLASRLSTPICRLTFIADEISRGNLGAALKETGRRDEIGALARAIERMGVSLQMSFEKLRKIT